MRILFASTHQVSCGIADYNADMMNSVGDSHKCDIAEFPQDAPPTKAELLEIADRASLYDLLIIQHEWSFIGADPVQKYDHLHVLLKRLRRNQVPTAFIFHSEFIPLLGHRRSRLFWRMRIARRQFINEINKSPLLRVYVHGKTASQKLLEQTIKPEKIKSVAFPLQIHPHTLPRTRQTGPITLLMFGFVSEYKGYETALNALRLLPENYHLVIAGGQHPKNCQDLTYENILGFIHHGEWDRGRQIPSVGRKFTHREREAFAARVRVTGHLSPSEIVEHIKCSDIVLAPYFADGAPSGSAAVAWPISLGKPTIVSCAHTFDEYIKAQCVAVVAPGAPHQLAETIQNLAERPTEMERLSSAALRFARENSVEALVWRIISTVTNLKSPKKITSIAGNAPQLAGAEQRNWQNSTAADQA